MQLSQCPYCQHAGTDVDFERSPSGECFCPRCGGEFLIEEDDEDADE